MSKLNFIEAKPILQPFEAGFRLHHLNSFSAFCMYGPSLKEDACGKQSVKGVHPVRYVGT